MTLRSSQKGFYLLKIAGLSIRVCFVEACLNLKDHCWSFKLFQSFHQVFHSETRKGLTKCGNRNWNKSGQTFENLAFDLGKNESLGCKVMLLD